METPLKRTLRAITARDPRPIKALRLLTNSGALTPEHQALVAEHYGFAPTFAVMAYCVS